MTEPIRLNGLPENQGKEWMSLAYMQAICAQAGLNISQTRFDNGIDLHVGSTKPISGMANVFLYLQLKSTETWKVENDGFIKYDLPVENYKQLCEKSTSSQYLVLFTLPTGCHNWVKYNLENENHLHIVELRHMAYYYSLEGLPATKNKKKVRIKVPAQNHLTSQTLIRLFNIAIQELSWVKNLKEMA